MRGEPLASNGDLPVLEPWLSGRQSQCRLAFVVRWVRAWDCTNMTLAITEVLFW